MCGGGCLWLLVCLGRWWSGPAGGAASAEGRLAVASASRYVWRGVGVVGCRVCWYRRHTLCCLCLVVVGAPLRAWCVWGWHAVGVLGQCALGCPARPGFHFLGFWVGVGGLVVNCIVDASILL